MAKHVPESNASHVQNLETVAQAMTPTRPAYRVNLGSMSRYLRTGWQFAVCLLSVMAVIAIGYLFTVRWHGEHHHIHVWKGNQ